jgi:hypothetical protein
MPALTFNEIAAFAYSFLKHARQYVTLSNYDGSRLPTRCEHSARALRLMKLELIRV